MHVRNMSAHGSTRAKCIISNGRMQIRSNTKDARTGRNTNTSILVYGIPDIATDCGKHAAMTRMSPRHHPKADWRQQLRIQGEMYQVTCI